MKLNYGRFGLTYETQFPGHQNKTWIQIPPIEGSVGDNSATYKIPDTDIEITIDTNHIWHLFRGYTPISYSD